jgi:hypothetical protein
MNTTRIKHGVVTALAFVGALGLGYVVFLRMGTSDTVRDTLGSAARTVEKATMKPGTYTVQLEHVELADEDWTTNAVVRGPKSVTLSVVRGGKVVFKRDLGAFRGKKTFLENPVTWNVVFDDKTPITLELAETEVVSDGKSYSKADVWPFTITTLGRSSRISFTWKPTVEARE